IREEIVEQAKKNLKKYINEKVYCKDASNGYKRASHYNRILETAGAKKLPEKIVDQLTSKGIMIIPIGLYYQQKLMKITKNKKIKKENLGDFIFVPLRGEY
ncbi:protein-L-isoaspartate O-methyltransferase, partial [archaeon]|nr:protein-L-isoaspartate O-methyltransferase [archaeon]